MKTKFTVGLTGTLAIAFGSIAHALQSDADGFKAGSDNTVPTGALSIAAGWSNMAVDGSLAVGEFNVANLAGFAMGSNNTLDANTYFSAGIGALNYLGYSESTIALGAYNTLGLQFGSVALGGSNQMNFPFGKTGTHNVLIGQLNTIDGNSASAPSNIQGTVLIGVDNQSVSTMAWALGKGNVAQTDTVTLGTYASEVQNASLIVGNGLSSSARSNGLVVLRNGTVSIPSGNLTLGGAPALTSSSVSPVIGSILSSGGYLKKANGSGAIADSTALFAMGTNASATGDGALAFGGYQPTAAANSSVAIGSWSNASAAAEFGENVAIAGGQASGSYAFATHYGEAHGEISIGMAAGFAYGDGAVAIGGYDWLWANWPGNLANAENSTAIGGIGNQAQAFCSNVSGYWNYANSAYSVVLGSANQPLSGASATEWVETDPLLELGNGWSGRSSSSPPSGSRSNAITTLKNGQTTLTNKAWKTNVAGDPLEDPPATTTDSGGNALVVDGHTVLNGKVIISEPQGDISMGIYE